MASTAGRIRVLALVFAVLFSLAGARAAQFQVLDASTMRDEALSNIKTTRDLTPLRGQILDKDGQVLAFTEATVDLVAAPNLIAGLGTDVTKATQKEKDAGAKIPAALGPVIARCASLDATEVTAQLGAKNSDGSFKSYVKVATQVPIDVYNCIQTDPVVDNKEKNGFGRKLNWVIGKDANPMRVYPMRTVASNTVGFMSAGKAGGGLELALNATLTGTPGKEEYEASRNGRIPLGGSTITPAVDGNSVTTTLDSGLCWQTQQLLDKQRSDKGLEWGFTVVMEVKTGKLLCLANTPSFDGNAVGAAAKADPSVLGNPAMTSPYEPGSTVKLLTLASVLDAGGATPDSITPVASTSDGIKSGNHTIRDSDKHPAVDYTTRGILVNSSNQGVIELARKTFSSKGAPGKQTYADYLSSFGLGKKTNIGLPGESVGVFPADKIVNDSYTIDSVAFGTSLSVNAVAMAAAANSIANDGVYVAPSLIASTTAPDGTVTPAAAPATHRVIKESTSNAVLDMMEDRVLSSFSTIGIPGVRTGAKTGTARMGTNNLVMSIVGVAPLEDPQLLVYTVYFQKGSQSGAGISVAGPVYHSVMSLAIQRYGILPSADFESHCLMRPLKVGDAPKKEC